MSGPMAIRYTYEGRVRESGGHDDSALAVLLPDFKEAGIAVEVIPDGLAGVRERLPAGARVRTGKYGQWKRGYGTVVESGEFPCFARWPQSGPSAWFMGGDAVESCASVCVEFDGDGYAGWWPASWIERMS